LAEQIPDPAGENCEQEHLRSMGKWKFILLRGIVGFSGPLFVWLALSRLSEDISLAHYRHIGVVRYLLQSWIFGLFMCAFLGAIVGLLAWRRITSEVWPGAEPDPESSITRLGPIANPAPTRTPSKL